jgi:PAS domain S-box-containing protein
VSWRLLGIVLCGLMLLTSVSRASEGLNHNEFAQLISSRVTLTEEESTFLKGSPLIRFRVAENPPEQFFENGVAVGLSIDYAKIACATFNLKCVFIPYLGGPFAEALAKIGQADGPDVFLTGRRTPEREELALFTNPYLFTPSVILTRNTSPNIFSLADLSDKTVVIERGYVIGKLLQESVPNIKLMTVDNTLQALETLAGGIGDAYVGNLTTATFVTAKLNLANLKVAAPTNFPVQGESMMVRRDWPELASLIDKTLLALSPGEKQQLQNYWYALKYDDGGWRAYGMWISVAAGALALALAAFLFRNRQLRVVAQQSARQMKRLESTLPGALYEYTTGTDGICEFRYFSDSIQSVIGYSPADLIGSGNPLTHHIHAEDLPRFLNTVQISRETGKPFFIEVRIQTAQGSWKWIQMNAAAQGDDDMKTTWSGHLLDISERKNLERSAERATLIELENKAISRLLKEKEHFVTAMLNDNRNAATGALSASIAHELNQPLGASSLNIQFLKRQLERNELNPSLSREILNNLDEDNQRAADVIEALRSIFLDSKPSPTALNINEQIQEVLSATRPIISKANITLDLQFSAGLLVAIHKDELHKILLNLITNAIESFDDSLATKDPAYIRTLSIHAARQAQTIYLSVTDNGRGISTDKSPTLFDLLSTQNDQSAGLGLWLCQHIVLRYGGKIWHEQPSTGGSRFNVELPAWSA